MHEKRTGLKPAISFEYLMIINIIKGFSNTNTVLTEKCVTGRNGFKDAADADAI